MGSLGNCLHYLLSSLVHIDSKDLLTKLRFFVNTAKENEKIFFDSKGTLQNFEGATSRLPRSYLAVTSRLPRGYPAVSHSHVMLGTCLKGR